MSRKILYYMIVPGIVIHEIAHALTVILTPSASLTNVDFTSHVEHEGRYTILRAFFISYSPLIMNTLIALFSAYSMSLTNPYEGLREVIMFFCLGYITFITAFTALPSWSDAIFPLKVCKERILSISGLILFPIILIWLIIVTPGIVFSFISSRSSIARILSRLMFFILVISLGFGLILPIEDMINGVDI